MPHIRISRMNTLNHCEMQHHYGYMEALEPKAAASPAMQQGTAIHKSLERYYNKEATPDMVPEDATFWAHHNAALHQYANFAMLNDRFSEVVGTEVPFELPIEEFPGWTIKGIIDLVVRIDGQLWIGEHKTTGQFWPIEQVGLASQHKLYELAAMELYGEPVAGTFYNFIRISNRAGAPHAEVKRTYLPANEMGRLSAYEEVLKAIARIEGTEPPRRNVGRHCQWCPFFNLCQTDYYGTDRDYVKQEYYRPKEEKVETVEVDY